MTSRIITAFFCCFTSGLAISNDFDFYDDWGVHHATGLSAKVRGAIAATAISDKNFGYECNTSNNQAWVFVSFKGKVEDYSNRTYKIVVGKDQEKPIFGTPIQKNKEYVSIKAFSIGNDNIDYVFKAIKNASSPIDIHIYAHNSEDLNEAPEQFYYKASERGSTKALTIAQQACGHDSFTGINFQYE